MNHAETRQVLDALTYAKIVVGGSGLIDAAIALCEASLARVVEPVGKASNMPGTEGFTMACFKASEVPVGAELFLATPQVAAQPSQAGELVAENERLRVALRFYANGDHYYLDEDEEFDTVSGEPANWLHSGVEDSATSIEDGAVARLTLRGEAITWIDGDEDGTPARIDGEPDPAAINAKGTP